MDEALDLERLRASVRAIGALGAPVEALMERLEQAGGGGGPVMLDEIEDVAAVVQRVQKAVQEALSGTPRGDTGEFPRPATVTADAGVELGPLVQTEVEKALETLAGKWREDILARTVAEVSQKTAKGLSDLIQSRAFLDRIVPQVLTKAEDAARRSVGELGLSLRQQIREELEKAAANSGSGGGEGGGGASAAQVVEEVLQKLNDSGVLDRAPAATGAPVNLDDVFDSRTFKESLEARLHHIVKYIEADVVPDAVKKAMKDG